MSIGVGNLFRPTQRTIRATPNPLDKCTIVSIYPKEISERKPTIEPGFFHIDAGSFEKPAILIVGPSSWWKETDEGQPLLEIPHSSILIAESFIKDFANGLIECNMNDIMPGLFFVPGELTIEEIRKIHMPLLLRAQEKQKRWYEALVKMSDVLWARTNGNPLSISDDARIAARSLNLNNKPWLQDFQTIELRNCPACGALRNENYPICGSCKTVIDPEAFKKLGLTQVVK